VIKKGTDDDEGGGGGGEEKEEGELGVERGRRDYRRRRRI